MSLIICFGNVLYSGSNFSSKKIFFNQLEISNNKYLATQQLNKPVLSLTNIDYNDHGLSDLLTEKGDAYEINLEAYYMLRDTITGWPGEKPKTTHVHHPERSNPFPKKVLIFSPHPDDDIISMGSTFMRLHDQGHEVHVGY